MSVGTTTKPKRRARGIPKQSFEPVGARLVVERDDADEVSPGGIVLPDQAQDKPRLGTVLAVGPGPRLHGGGRGEMQMKVGDRVLLSPYAENVILEGHEIVLAREEDILAIIRDG